MSLIEIWPCGKKCIFVYSKKNSKYVQIVWMLGLEAHSGNTGWSIVLSYMFPTRSNNAWLMLTLQSGRRGWKLGWMPGTCLESYPQLCSQDENIERQALCPIKLIFCMTCQRWRLKKMVAAWEDIWVCVCVCKVGNWCWKMSRIDVRTKLLKRARAFILKTGSSWQDAACVYGTCYRVLQCGCYVLLCSAHTFICYTDFWCVCSWLFPCHKCGYSNQWDTLCSHPLALGSCTV